MIGRRMIAGVLALFALFPCVALAQRPPLRVWLIFSELASTGPPPTTAAIDAFVDHWNRRGVGIESVREAARQNSAFARYLLGQTVILEELATYQSHAPSQLEVSFFTWAEYFEELSRAAAAPTAAMPHVVQVPSSWCGTFQDLGLLAVLPESIEQRADRDFNAKLAATCRMFGEQRLGAVPWMIDVRLLFFHRAIVPGLEAEPGVPVRDRQQFYNALVQARPSAAVPLMSFPVGQDWDLLHQTALLIRAFGGNLVTIEHNLLDLAFRHRIEPAFRDSAAAALLFIQRLVKQGLVTLPVVTRTDLEEDFLEARVGSVLAGPWLLPRLFERYGDDWSDSVGVILPPFGTGADITFLGGTLLGITPAVTTEGRSDDALMFIDSITRGRSAVRLAWASGRLPAARQTLGTVGIAPDGEPATYFEQLATFPAGNVLTPLLQRALDAGETYPAVPNWASRVEVRATLSSLFFLWRDLAENRSEDRIRAGITAIERDWASALQLPRPAWVVWSLGSSSGLFSILAVWGLGRSWNRRRQIRRLEVRLGTVRDLERKVNEVEDAGQLLRNEVTRLEGRIRAVSDPGEAPFTIVLPGNRMPLTIRRTGPDSRIQSREVSGQIEALLDFLARQTWYLGLGLTSDRWYNGRITPLTLEFVLGPDAKPTDRVTRIANRIRDQFKGYVPRYTIVPRVEHSISMFALRRTTVECLIRDGEREIDFAENVCERLQRSRQLLDTGAHREALAEALRVWQLECDLALHDPQLLILLGRIRQTLDRGTGDQAGTPGPAGEDESRQLTHAMNALDDQIRRIRHLLESWASTNIGGEADEQRRGFETLLAQMIEARGSPPPELPCAPAWTIAAAVMMKVRNEAAIEVDRRLGELDEASRRTAAADRNDLIRNEIREWFERAWFERDTIIGPLLKLLDCLSREHLIPAREQIVEQIRNAIPAVGTDESGMLSDLRAALDQRLASIICLMLADEREGLLADEVSLAGHLREQLDLNLTEAFRSVASIRPDAARNYPRAEADPLAAWVIANRSIGVRDLLRHLQPSTAGAGADGRFKSVEDILKHLATLGSKS